MLAGQFGQRLTVNEPLNDYLNTNTVENGRLKDVSKHTPFIEYEVKFKKIPAKLYTKKAKEIGGKIISLSGNPESIIGSLSDFVIEIKGKSKDTALTQESLAPYTSLFDISSLAVLDSIGGILMEKLNVTEIDIDNRHASIE